MARPRDRFVTLTDLHEELLAEFERHQFALLYCDFSGARA